MGGGGFERPKPPSGYATDRMAVPRDVSGAGSELVGEQHVDGVCRCRRSSAAADCTAP